MPKHPLALRQLMKKAKGGGVITQTRFQCLSFDFGNWRKSESQICNSSTFSLSLFSGFVALLSLKTLIFAVRSYLTRFIGGVHPYVTKVLLLPLVPKGGSMEPPEKTTFPPEFCNEICTIYVRDIKITILPKKKKKMLYRFKMAAK